MDGGQGQACTLPVSPDLSAVRDRLRWWGSHYRASIEALMPGDRRAVQGAGIAWDERPGAYAGGNVLADLIDHQGFVPGATVRATRPVDPDAARVEAIVCRLHAAAPLAATVVRAHYCGRGPVGDKANLIARAFKVRMRKPQYYRELQSAEFFVMGWEGKR